MGTAIARCEGSTKRSNAADAPAVATSGAPSAAVAWVASAHTDGDDVVARVAHSPVSFHR